MSKRPTVWLLAAVATLVIGGVIGDFLIVGHSQEADEVHVHADFLMYIHDSRVRFTDPTYQSDGEQVQHDYIHFHDGKDEVVHRHAEGVTLAAFLESLGYELTDQCLVTDTGTRYCSENGNELTLFVNGTEATKFTEYITSEGDRILLYYGDPMNPRLAEYQNAISNDACIYSGSCPERGVPPSENCGLTCDVAAFVEDTPYPISLPFFDN